MVEKEFLVRAKGVSEHFLSQVDDLGPEEQEDLCIALFNLKTRIVTDEEDDRTFFEFSKAMSMKGNALFDEFSKEMHHFSSMPDNSAWFVEYAQGVDILRRALENAAPEFLAEVIADRCNVEALPDESGERIIIRQHALTPGIGDTTAEYFFKETRETLADYIDVPRQSAGPRM